jgi:energy-coupling factor transporter ATP-binding protein EcfA2
VEWLDNPSFPWLVLHGEKGVGKSHLANILALLFMAKSGRPARSICWSPWIKEQHRRIERSKAGHELDEGGDVTALFHVPFLVLDDISTGQVGASAWALELLFTVLQERQDKLTVFTTNIGLSDRRNQPSRFRKMLTDQAERLNGSKATYLDLVEKICDRFGMGPGRRVKRYVKLIGRVGSYRQAVEE